MINTKQQILAKIIPWLVESVMKQGMTFVLMGLMSYFFWQWGLSLQQEGNQKIDKLEIKINQLQTEIKEYYKEDRIKMMNVIEANTRALANLKCK